MSQQLDDHIAMLQSMSCSPYKKPFEDRLAKWDTTLNLVRAGVASAEADTNRVGVAQHPRLHAAA